MNHRTIPFSKISWAVVLLWVLCTAAGLWALSAAQGASLNKRLGAMREHTTPKFANVVARLVTQKANDVATQLRLAIGDDEDPDFSKGSLYEIAVQSLDGQPVSVGSGSYTCVFSRSTTRMLAHPNPEHQDRRMEELRDKEYMEEWWAIFERSTREDHASGHYQWPEKVDNKVVVRRKFMSITPVADESDWMVAATQYSDAFNAPAIALSEELEEGMNEDAADLIRTSWIVAIPLSLLIVATQSFFMRRIQGVIREVSQFTARLGLGRYKDADPLPVSRIRELSLVYEDLETLQDKLIKLEEFRTSQAITAGSLDVTKHVVHEIRTPLEKIHEALRKLDDDIAPSSDCVALLRDAKKNLEELVDEILHPRESHLGSIERFDLSAVLRRQVLRDRELHANLKEPIDFGCEDRTSGLWVIGSKKEILRVVVNLLKNAADAIHGRGRVTVTLEEQGGNAKVSVTDTGRGMSQEVSSRIFQNNYSYGKDKGNGVGLFLCKQIVSDHGGRIRLANTSPQGSTFEFELPLPGVARGADDGGQRWQLDVEPDTRILVVDDNTTMLTKWFLTAIRGGVVGDYFESFEQFLDEQHDGEEGTLSADEVDWDAFADRYGLVVLDYLFVGSAYSGIDICELVREHVGDRVPVVICSRHADKQELLEYSTETGVRVLAKAYFEEFNFTMNLTAPPA
jgi:signal transduction histidine kinase